MSRLASKYSNSDKLTLALFFTANALSSAFYLASRNLITSVSVSLMMIASMVYPIFHFFESAVQRSVASVLLLCLLSCFEIGEWPLNEPTNVPPATTLAKMNDPVDPCSSRILISGISFEGNGTIIKADQKACIVADDVAFYGKGVAIDVASANPSPKEKKSSK